MSNDADLALPIKMVRTELGLPVGVVNPNLDPRMMMPRELSSAAAFTRNLRKNTLRDHQLPPTLTDAVGTITKPASW